MMDKRTTYHTKQKEQIAQLISQQTQEFTVKELFDELTRTNAGVGLTTVYRAVDRLWKDGLLCKSVGKSGAINYRFNKHCRNS